MARVAPSTAPSGTEEAAASSSQAGHLGRTKSRSVSQKLLKGPKDEAHWLLNSLREYEAVLRQPPLVAALLPPSEARRWPREAEEGVKVCAEYCTEYFGESRHLLVCHMTQPKGTPQEQLTKIHHLLKDILPTTGEDGKCRWMWPLHQRDVGAAVMATQELMLAGRFQKEAPMRCWWRVLHWLHICNAPGGGEFIKVLYNQHGGASTFPFLWGIFYTQQLWLLMLLMVPWTAWLGWDKGFAQDGPWRRLCWELAKILILAWGLLAVYRRQRILDSSVYLSDEVPDIKARRNTGWRDLGICCMACRWGQMICCVVPVMAVFIMAVLLSVLGAAQLMVYLTYIWGDCLNYKPNCRDPETKWGILGWMAEVSVDILLAIVFEIYFALTKLLAKWLASLRNYPFHFQVRLSVEMLTLVISAIERIGTFGIIAFVFAPQWEKPAAVEAVNLSVSCADLFFGDGSFFCLQRRLPVANRRTVFERSLKGPFCVAPWVGMLVKVVLPMVARVLDRFARRATCAGCAAARFVARVLALIFSHDGDSVGCFAFVFKGWPFVLFSGPVLRSPASSPTASVVGEAVRTDEDLEGGARSPTTATAAASPAAAASPPATQLGNAIEEAPKTPLSGARAETGAGRGPEEGMGSDVEDVEEEEAPPIVGCCGSCGAAALDPQQAALDEALSQGVRKPWEPTDELLELELSFLWVMFFSPIMPAGTIVTLLARVVWVKTNLSKLLFVRRRVFPEPDGVERSLQFAYMRAVVCAAAGWSLGLSLLTYNNNLWDWGWGRFVATTIVILWLMVSTGVALGHTDSGYLPVVVGVAFLLLTAGCSFLFFDQLYGRVFGTSSTTTSVSSLLSATTTLLTTTVGTITTTTAASR